MLYYNKIDVSENIDVIKTSLSKEYFVGKGFRFNKLSL